MKILKYSILLLTILAFFSRPCSGEFYSTVYGKVIDEETGIGIKGVGVRVCLFFKHFGETRTDDQGKFVINNIPPGKYGIDFWPPEPYAWDDVDFTKFIKDPFVPKGMQIINVEKGKNLYVIKKCKIGGILLVRTFEKGTNIPIKGVDVSKIGVNLGITGGRPTVTDSDGLYRLGRLPAGTIELVLHKEGLWWKHIKDIEIQYNQTTTVDVPYDIASLNRISGKITCQQSGEPLKDILISIGSLDTRGWERCYTDENGNFSMLDMETGKYELTVFSFRETNGQKEEVDIDKTVFLFKDQPLTVNFVLDCNWNFRIRGDEI
jgi:hypothetical protein